MSKKQQKKTFRRSVEAEKKASAKPQKSDRLESQLAKIGEQVEALIKRKNPVRLAKADRDLLEKLLLLPEELKDEIQSLREEVHTLKLDAERRLGRLEGLLEQNTEAVPKDIQHILENFKCPQCKGKLETQLNNVNVIVCSECKTEWDSEATRKLGWFPKKIEIRDEG